MDEQRIEEIAKRHARENATKAAVLSNYTKRAEHTLFVVLKAAIREVLASQEEDLAFMREAVDAACKDRDYYEQKEKAAESRYQEEYRIVDRVWQAVRGGESYKGEEISAIVADYVKRAESAEAALRELREELRHAAIERNLAE